jgi:hypothetical protein
MRVVIEELARKDVAATALQRLEAALQPLTFAPVCCIGALGGPTVYLRCPDTPHGVLVNSTSMDESTVEWAIEVSQRVSSCGPCLTRRRS